MSELKIELIAIGDEILIGHTLDTNSNWIATRLVEQGFPLRWISVIGDNASDLRHQLKRAWNRADLVLLTGGLGPTHDDITRPVITSFFEDKLETRDDITKTIQARFAARDSGPPPGYEILAEFPSRARVIPNNHGSAPGIHYSLDERDLIAMPGVPVEMRGMMDGYVLPLLEKRRDELYRFMIIRTAGIGESNLSHLIGDAEQFEPVKLAYLPSIDHGVTLRIYMSGRDETQIQDLLVQTEKTIHERAGDYIYATGKTDFEQVIMGMLESAGMKLALAESCTGGMIADRIVGIPGSSKVFDRGFVTYSNQAKIEMLGVNELILEKHGAVSAETAVAMAEGALKNSNADIAVSVTGIAGPTGDTADKPIGLTYIAVADERGNEVKHYQFIGDRDSNRRRSAFTALLLLWNRLKKLSG